MFNVIKITQLFLIIFHVNIDNDQLKEIMDICQEFKYSVKSTNPRAVTLLVFV